MYSFRVRGLIIAFIFVTVIGTIIDLATNSITISAVTAGALSIIAISAIFIYSGRLFNKSSKASPPSVRSIEARGAQGVQIGEGNTQVNYFGRRDSSGVADITVSGEKGDAGGGD